MTIKQPRTVQLRCPDCGHTTPLTTKAMAEYGMRRHSCAAVKERAARAQRRLDRLAESGPEKPCQHNGRHPHGDRVRYVIDKCRCRPCRDACSAYERDRTRRRMYGKLTYVPADKARAHVHELQAQGMGWKRVAAAAGLDNSTVCKLLYGDPSRNMAPSKRIRPATEQALLAVRLDLAPGQKVDPTGTGRRLQALITLGWSVGQISAHSGLDRQCLDAAIHSQGITARTADAVRDAYDRMWDQAPPETNQRERIAASRSRRRAALNRWAPPLAWDDDAIDDPAATPQTGTADDERGVDEIAITRRLNGDATVHLSRAERWAVTERLARESHSDQQIATRIGVTSRTVLRDRQLLGIESRWVV